MVRWLTEKSRNHNHSTNIRFNLASLNQLTMQVTSQALAGYLTDMQKLSGKSALTKFTKIEKPVLSIAKGFQHSFFLL